MRGHLYLELQLVRVYERSPSQSLLLLWPDGLPRRRSVPSSSISPECGDGETCLGWVGSRVSLVLSLFLHAGIAGVSWWRLCNSSPLLQGRCRNPFHGIRMCSWLCVCASPCLQYLCSGFWLGICTRVNLMVCWIAFANQLKMPRVWLS